MRKIKRMSFVCIILFFVSISNGEIRVIAESMEDEESVTVMFTGDILMHDSLVESVRFEGEYRFDELFKYIKDEFENNDINVSNIESTVNEKRKVSGYPSFNSPKEILFALKELEVDALINSHNHVLDTGVDGLKRTLDNFKYAGIKSLGAEINGESKNLVYEKGKIKIGIAAYTYGVNGRNDHGDKINYIDRSKIAREIRELKNGGCNFVIVYLHIGNEYLRDVEDHQQRMINYIIEKGGDAVVCSHAHVPRISEIVDYKEKKIYINYGMGNFISNQNDPYTDIGSISKIKIGYKNGQAYLKSAQTIPIYRLRYGDKPKIYRTVKVSDIKRFKPFIIKSEYELLLKEARRIYLKYTECDTKNSIMSK